MRFVSAVVRLLVGAVFGVIAMTALVPAFAAFQGPSGEGAPVSIVVVAAGALLGLFAPSILRAFGRGFLLAGLAVLALPLSTLLLSGRVTSEMLERQNDAATAVGSGLAAIVTTGFAAFVGFFLGGILIVVGLVLALGGRREVIVVERSQGRIDPRL